MKAWQTHLTERELKEIEFCRVYQRDFSHGTDGHNLRLIVAKLAALLDDGPVAFKASLPDITKPPAPNKPASFT